jgi:MFS family permease
MKKNLIILFIVLAAVGGVIYLTRAAPATPAPGAQTPGQAPAKYPPPPGVGIAQTLSTITGVAISPLLGVSAVGCYQFCKAQTDEEKAKLPWFASPVFWIPAFLLLAACFVKDTAGTALPAPAKKPFDALETIEHKISGLVATGAFVPIMVGIIHEANSTGGQPTLSLSSLGFAAFTMPNWLYDVLVTPVAMFLFFIVFLASNSINILILLSPFTTIDAALKTFRATVLASVVGSSAIGSWSGHPWIGALWSLVIILISYLIAGWSFRLSHFGLVFVWEFFTGGRYRFKPDSKENRMFLGRKVERVPTRTYGALLRNDKGELVFNYRPWLVLPRRTLVLPPGTYEAGRGLFYSEILRVDGNSARTVFLLPPHYRGHEEEIARIYGLAGTREVGLRAAWAWFKGLFTSQPAPA